MRIIAVPYEVLTVIWAIWQSFPWMFPTWPARITDNMAKHASSFCWKSLCDNIATIQGSSWTTSWKIVGNWNIEILWIQSKWDADSEAVVRHMGQLRHCRPWKTQSSHQMPKMPKMPKCPDSALEVASASDWIAVRKNLFKKISSHKK